MKINSILVKTMFMNILTAGIFATGFTACSDDLNELEAMSGNAPKGESLELTSLEQYSYTVPVKVDIEGDWEIDFKFNDDMHHFCYAIPQKGHGPQTIKLCMLDNWTETRNEGRMTIRDLGNSNNNQTFCLMQKCNLDNPEYKRTLTRGCDAGEGDEKMDEAPIKNKGDIVTAVGYGYNINAEPGIKAISISPIIALDSLREAGVQRKAEYGPVFRRGDFSVNVESHTGYTVSEVSESMSHSATIKGAKAGFSSEVGASFTSSQKSGSNNLFCLTVANVNVGQAILQGIDRNNVRDFMTHDAKVAINGTGSAYQTSNEGFKQLIEHFGSHLIIRTDLGGRLRYAATVDRSHCSNTEELKAHANMEYKNKLMTANTKSSGEYSSTYSETKSHIVKSISATGGDYNAIAAMVTNDTTQNVDAWITSLGEMKNLAVINFSENKSMEMIPIYELIDRSTPEGQDRYARLKNYMENGQMTLDFYEGTTTYNQGEVIQLSFPDDWIGAINEGTTHLISGSLIREAVYRGKTVAWYCMEYIPSIEPTGLIPVVYPVQDNMPNFQAGRFIGTPTHEACNISWNSNGTCRVSAMAASEGLTPQLYLYANALYLSQPSGHLRTPQTQDMILDATKSDNSVTMTYGGGYQKVYVEYFHSVWYWEDQWLEKRKFTAYQYPLVKLGNRIWTREDYNGDVPAGSDYLDRFGTHIEKGRVYYTRKTMQHALDNTFPGGWHPANDADWANLRSAISNDGKKTVVGSRLEKKGQSGFNLEWNGWFSYNLETRTTSGQKAYIYYDVSASSYGDHHMDYITGDCNHVAIKDGKFEIVKGMENFIMQCRLVMDM